VWNLVFKSAATFSIGLTKLRQDGSIPFRQVNEHVVNGGMHVSDARFYPYEKLLDLR
jgi:hypothetical protein